MKHVLTFTLFRRLFARLFAVLALLGANAASGQNIAHGLKVVVIDAGHGGPKYPGASYRGIHEKDINLGVALELGSLIEREMPEVKVVYTRKTDMQFSTSLTADLQARADTANKAGGSLFISIHANAARSAAVCGVETLIMGESSLETRVNESVLYANNKEEFIDMSDQKTAAIVRAYIQNLQYTYGEYSEAMARIVQNNYAKAGRRVRGIKRQPLKVLYATDMPSILTEVGFMSNPDELAFMSSKKGQQAIARSLFAAVKDYAAYVRGTLLIEDLPATDDDPESTRPAASAPAPAPVADRAPEADPSAAETVSRPAAQKKGYAVQLFASSRRMGLHSAQLKKFRGRVLELTGQDSYRYKYCMGPYATRAEAVRALPEAREVFPGAFVVAYEGDRTIVEKKK